MSLAGPRSPFAGGRISLAPPAPGAEPAHGGTPRQSMSRERNLFSQPWQWIREPGRAFFRGSVLFLKKAAPC